ncbi:MAG: hypothetical protein WD009_12920 [Phycisphaeraceae bacterium]
MLSFPHGHADDPGRARIRPLHEQPSPTPDDAGSGATSPPRRDDRRRDHAPVPSLQLAVLLWCLWLLVHWLLAMTLNPPLRLERWIILIAAVGYLALWPTLRLAQRPSATAPAPALILLEWLALGIVFQALIWPLGFIARWSLTQTAWVNTAMLAWALLAAAFVAWGATARRGIERAIAAALCILILIGEPVVMALLALGGQPGWPMRISPLQTLWRLTAPFGEYRPEPWTHHAIAIAVAAVFAWTLVVLLTRLTARQPNKMRDRIRR